MRVSLTGKDVPEVMFKYKGNDDRRIRILEMIAEGGNGLVYRAVEEEGRNKTACVIKEYYPEEDNITVSNIEYFRKAQGAPLQIKSKSRKDRDVQILAQNLVTEQEVRVTQSLFYEHGKDFSNSPYVYKMVRLNEMIDIPGDAVFLKIDTTDGKTLKELANNSPSTRKNPYSAVKNALAYLEKMLVLVDFISAKGFVHGDLAFDNLYISGDRMMALDFGSAFQRSEYLVEDFYSEDDVFSVADKISNNISIGSSHANTRSPAIETLSNAKRRYKLSPGIENARELVRAIKAVDASADIYSCIMMFYQLLTGFTYEYGASPQRVAENMYGDCQARDYLSDLIHEIMSLNGEMHYVTTSHLRKEMREISEIIDRQCTPRALIQALHESLKKEKPVEILKELLPELELRQLPKTKKIHEKISRGKST